MNRVQMGRTGHESGPRISWLASAAMLAACAILARPAFSLEGTIGIHDPSTIMYCNGKYYTFGTGGSALVSEDGWHWEQGTRPPRGGLAPDVVKLEDRYCLYVAANVGGQPHAVINMIWTKSLDPEDPDYGWQEGGVVCSTNGEEFANGIDAGCLLDPSTGKLWLIYGSYFGYLRIVELDPKTGERIDLDSKPYDVAINCEAAILLYRDGWYYLLATHGSCCAGTDSGYNIRVGRSAQISGPYLDHTGLDMMLGGGTLFLGSGGRVVGAGHFGLFDEGEGVEKFSIHWEADLDRGGASVLEILPLKWEDGWPVAGEKLTPGSYQLSSIRTGTALEMAVEAQPVGGGRRGGFGGFGGRRGGAQLDPLPDQDVTQVSANWPAGAVPVRMANYMCQAQQKWTIAPVEGAGGVLGVPYYKIAIEGTDRVLAATSDAELVVQPEFTGAPEQLWRVEMLTDGTYRVMPKVIPGSETPMALSAIGASSATLSKFDPKSDKHRWTFKQP